MDAIGFCIAATGILLVVGLYFAARRGWPCPQCRAWFTRSNLGRSFDGSLVKDVCNFRCTKCDYHWYELRNSRWQTIYEIVVDMFLR
jgi:transposase-like protein